ncbi:hypothetical protein Dxin01_03840 [Deinococcus xinjiangensis]|uniref:Lipopolysaccharide assembly protein A domain-containing protein n=1 Tax=Deinococcus xinjiangensis TaxID=457454 RepID=A0ABP9VFT7_9DEIO
MPFVQVLLLLGLLAYLLLVTLENPELIHLPLPFGRGELLLSAGAAMSLFLALGGLYTALLLLPMLLGNWQHRQREKRENRVLEDRLAATLQARLAALPTERASTEQVGLERVGE